MLHRDSMQLVSMGYSTVSSCQSDVIVKCQQCQSGTDLPDCQSCGVTVSVYTFCVSSRFITDAADDRFVYRAVEIIF